jgi:hypothetical protein
MKWLLYVILLAIGVVAGAIIQDSVTPVRTTTVYRTVKHPICVAVHPLSDECKNEMKEAERTYLKEIGSKA